MKDSLYIAWKYIHYNRAKTITLVACITITLFLPASLEVILSASEKQLTSRANNSPLLIGAKGSALDLTMNALYFDDELPSLISLETLNEISQTELGIAIPLYNRFKARNYPIIGTSLEYFEQRKLRIKDGRTIVQLGDCVIGAEVAQNLGFKVGDHIISSPENLFDLAGVYPLKMKIVGILDRTRTLDDKGIFVDLKTSWVIEGLGHGHQDLEQLNDPTLIAEKSDSVIKATAKLIQFNEITDANMQTFHFHGSQDKYPISSILVFPNDTKSEALLRGRYIGKEVDFQLIKPNEVIEGLLANIFRIRNVLDTVIAVVAFATILAMILVFTLSLKLRSQEIETIFKLGCSKGTITRILAAEIIVIFSLSIMLCSFLLMIINLFKDDVVGILLMG